MYKTKTLLIVSLLLVINGCSLVPSFGKKKDKDSPLEKSAETIETFDGDMFPSEDLINETESTETISGQKTVGLDNDWFVETASLDSSLIWEDPSSNISDDQLSTYSSVVSDQQDEITKLKSDIRFLTDEFYKCYSLQYHII